MKVLVVAEDLGVRSALTCVVKYFGWESHGCNQHADAAVLIEQLAIDVALVDHAMLGVDGLVVVETDDALLITTRARSQDVSKIVRAVHEGGREDLI